MFEFVCLAGMAFGSFWGFNNLPVPVNTEKGVGAGAIIGRSNPEIFSPIPAEKKEGANDAPSVVAFWDNHIHSTEDLVNKDAKVCGLAGRVYLFSADGQARDADGKITVDLYSVDGKQQIKIAQWTFDAECLKKLKRPDPIGDGYTLFLPWESVGRQETNFRLNLSYESAQGTVLRASPASVTLGNKQGKETNTDGAAKVPTPFYTHGAPKYFPPPEPYPLPKELRSLSKEVYDDFVGSSKTTPVPAQPWNADTIKEWVKPSDSQGLILPPLKPGEKPSCTPPDQAEILRALPRRQRGVPYLYEEFRHDIEFTVEKMVDRLDAPRFFSLIGQAQMHLCHWKCTVYFTETIEAAYPWPFRVQRKRAEVVYIDKDRLYLCATAPSTSAAPNASCPAGCASAKTVASSRAKAAGVEQVQLDVVIAKLNRSALPKGTYRWAETQFVHTGADASFGVVSNSSAFREFLQALRGDGFAKILAEPRLITLSGRPGCVLTGGEMPVTTEANSRVGVTYQHFGVKLEVLPTVQANGKIHLEARPEISQVEAAAIPKINRRKMHVAASLDAGQTLAIRGLREMSKSPVPILGELPFVGEFFEQETEHELLILVTPRIVSAAPPVVQAGHTEECEPASKPKQVRRGQMTVNDVVRMSQKNIAEDIILRQMELTNAMFNLSVDDIIELHDAGVNATIIRAMQERREENATQGKAGYSSDAIDRMTEMRIDSENLRQLHDEWRRLWMNDQPSHLTPNRTPASPSSK